jgi:ADP-dependent NAD(P)H-hydrate dehydratase / NAD(P)H-hydrate epimerase
VALRQAPRGHGLGDREVKKLVACAEASRLDAQAAQTVQSLLLMEDASLLLWQALEPIAAETGAGQEGLLLALCGSGNNGGDALAILRHASFSGLGRVAAILVKEPGELASVHSTSLRALGVRLLDWRTQREECEALLSEASLIIDGISGTGLAGELRGDSASLVEAVKGAVGRSGPEEKPSIAAIDLPSGLSDAYEDSWPLVAADYTLSVEPRKACLYHPTSRQAVGRILPIDGVFPVKTATTASAFLLEEGDLASLAPLPPDSSYKGSRGKVGIFAGAVGTSGAAALCARSCLAAGAGIASLFVSSAIYPILASMLDSVMVKVEAEDQAEGAAAVAGFDALLIGPGWGRTEARRRQLKALLELGIPAVLDADAIYLYRDLRTSGFKPKAQIILTPHPGEFAALSGLSSEKVLASPREPLVKAAGDFDAVITLKSHVTWIAASDGRVAVWDGMECGLGTAGSGDVLAGLSAGLLSRLPGFDAARAAVIAHGLAGRAERAERGWFEADAIREKAAQILGKAR